jgi:hypothetical protein
LKTSTEGLRRQVEQQIIYAHYFGEACTLYEAEIEPLLFNMESSRKQMIITLKLNSGVFWEGTSCSLVDGYQCSEKVAASVFREEKANSYTEDEAACSKTSCNCVSNYSPSHLQTLSSVPALRSTKRIVKAVNFPKADISNK